MTVDHIPLPFTAICPPPPSPWPAADSDPDPVSVHAPRVDRPRRDEPLSSPSGWPRVFPGL
jgi:hypothetical protein